MFEKALKRITEAKKNQSISLDLSNCDLVVLPKEISELFSLGALFLSENKNLSDLSLLENLTNLTTLCIFNTQVSDLSPLANLTKLTRLDVFNTQVSDLSPLANLT
ncbi:MAG TPA: leucine-rich repeat domain-containing protein, partial [Haliscomenobacter sp.]|uniref:leucine-rich repeat domain-containing protein n=1 Tax=Haliscomenobacter sp. TaxID=2717303 RepID=UPI002C2E5553